MQKVIRPSGVPEEATWDKSENVWQHGPKKSRGVVKKIEVPVGEWRYWRADGSLCCIANFDEEGRQHGVVERFHNDGTLASRGMWKNGNRHGHFVFVQSKNKTDEHYPSNYETWRYEFDSTANWQEDNIRWFLEDGTECTSDGRSIETAYDLDTVIGAAEPEKFLEKYAAAIHSAAADEDRDEPVSEVDPMRIEELWGVTAPEIDVFVKYACDADSFNRATNSRLFEDNNIWRSIIAHPWENDSEELAALFMGAVKIGYFGDSDHVYATIFQTHQEHPSANVVFLWDHETYYVNEVLSLSLDDFAFRLAVAGAYDRERLSKTAAQAAWRKLSGRSYVDWAACSGLETLTEADEEPVDKSEFQVDLDPNNEIRGRFWRAQWIIQLLHRDSNRDWSSIQECFRPGWNVALNDNNFESLLESGRDRLYQTALYLLWRLFWFNDQQRLAECCDAFRDHPARVVRDLVELLEDIGNGETKIDGIENILAVREDFLALDLAPEREEQRVQEAETVATTESARAIKLAGEAAAVAKLGLPALLNEAWSRVTDPIAMKAFENAARTIPGYEAQWRAFDWVRDGEYIRAEQHLTDEAIGVGIWLGQNQSDVLQPFIWSSIFSDRSGHLAGLLLPAIGVASGALDPRLVSCCIAQLDVVEEYNFTRRLAVELLGVMREKAVVARLCALIDEYFIALAGKTDFDARLASIPWEDLLTTICQALADLADPAELESAAIVRGALRKLLTHSLREHLNPRAVALDALVAWGETDVLEFVGRFLSLSDDPEQIVALRAVEKLAPVLNPEARRNFIALQFRNPADHENAVTLMYYRAAHALCKTDPEMIETESMSNALGEARSLENYGTEGWLKWRIIECETVGQFPELDIDSIQHHTRSANFKVRKAAETAYTTRGISPPLVRPIYWPLVWQAVDTASTPQLACIAIAGFLADSQSVDRAAPAAWLWANNSEDAASILAQTVERELDRYLPIGSGENLPSETEWLIRALAKHAEYPSAQKAIARCIASEHNEIRACVVQEFDSLPVNFAPALLSIAKEDEGWQRCYIAQWALAREIDPQMSSALKDARISIAKLKNWTK